MSQSAASLNDIQDTMALHDLVSRHSDFSLNATSWPLWRSEELDSKPPVSRSMGPDASEAVDCDTLEVGSTGIAETACGTGYCTAGCDCVTRKVSAAEDALVLRYRG